MSLAGNDPTGPIYGGQVAGFRPEGRKGALQHVGGLGR